MNTYITAVSLAILLSLPIVIWTFVAHSSHGKSIGDSAITTIKPELFSYLLMGGAYLVTMILSLVPNPFVTYENSYRGVTLTFGAMIWIALTTTGYFRLKIVGQYHAELLRLYPQVRSRVPIPHGEKRALLLGWPHLALFSVRSVDDQDDGASACTFNIDDPDARLYMAERATGYQSSLTLTGGLLVLVLALLNAVGAIGGLPAFATGIAILAGLAATGWKVLAGTLETLGITPTRVIAVSVVHVMRPVAVWARVLSVRVLVVALYLYVLPLIVTAMFLIFWVKFGTKHSGTGSLSQFAGEVGGD